jgi:hypothetical protein
MSVISSRSCSLSSCPSQGQTRQQSLVYSFWECHTNFIIVNRLSKTPIKLSFCLIIN